MASCDSLGGVFLAIVLVAHWLNVVLVMGFSWCVWTCGIKGGAGRVTVILVNVCL